MRKSWPLEPLGRHVALVSGQHIEAARCNEEGVGKPYLTGPADFPDGKIFVTKFTRFPKVVCEAGDLLVTVKGSGAGKTTVAHDSYCISRQLMAVRPVSMDSGYLHHVLTGRTEQMRADALGFIPGIGRGDVLSMPVRVPPLSEQQRIAEILDTVDDAIRKTEQIIAKLKQVKQGLLHDLLTRGIDDNGELRDPHRHPDQFKDSPLGRIPKGWGTQTLAELAESAVDGPFGSNLKSSHYVSEPGVRVVRLQNIGEGEYVQQDAYVSSAHSESLFRHDVHPDDMLVASLGDDRHPFGRACLYPRRLTPGIVKADCLRFRFNGNQTCSGFVMLALNAPRWRKGLRRLAQGVTRDRVNLGNLLRFTIPVAPLGEQRLIWMQLASFRERIDREVAKVSKLHQLKQGLMEDLLTGRVRVTALLDQAAE